MKNIILAAFMLLSFVASAQNIGQTKAYIVSDLNLCKVLINEPKYIVFECGTSTAGYYFDSDGLCDESIVKMTLSDWNDLKKTVISERCPLLYCGLGYSIFENNNTDIWAYRVGETLYTFYEGDFYGNNKYTHGSLRITKK
ncbi:MAG: hypothetical protein Q7T74_05435 [Candidatus Saccharibacteria bacterium]|nr:hypothetical protein [Candidatus Saccharibacteria bacterium]